MGETSFKGIPKKEPEGGVPFAGIPTFAGVPLWSGEDADVVMMGVPYDEGTTNRPGTRFGPRAIREASMLYSYDSYEDRFYDTDKRRWILRGKRIVDAGDVPIEPLARERNFDLITEDVKKIRSVGALVGVMGGDHSVTYPVLKGYGEGQFSYLHFDSHIDCDSGFLSRYTHGSPVANIIRDELAEEIYVMGIRGFSNSGHDIKWAEKQGVKTVTASEFKAFAYGKGTIPVPGGDCYISVDIDFFDPSAAPGTGTPEPGGVFLSEFLQCVEILREKVNVIGFDVMEVNPLFDNPSQITSGLAVRVILALLDLACGENPLNQKER